MLYLGCTVDSTGVHEKLTTNNSKIGLIHPAMHLHVCMDPSGLYHPNQSSNTPCPELPKVFLGSQRRCATRYDPIWAPSAREKVCTRSLPSFPVPEFLALKQKNRILGHSYNPVCGFSMMEQVTLCAVWPLENWLGSFLNQIQTGLDHCPRILLSCFRSRISALFPISLSQSSGRTNWLKLEPARLSSHAGV